MISLAVPGIVMFALIETLLKISIWFIVPVAAYAALLIAIAKRAGWFDKGA
jgi:hypothetical protein